MEISESSPKTEPNRLVEAYRSYAHAIAAEVWRKLSFALDNDDVRAAAELGLVEAAQSFDPTRGVQFKTFAYYRIRGAIYDGLRKTGWFSESRYEQYRFEIAANEYLKDQSVAASPEVETQQAYDEMRNIAGSVVSCYLLSLESLTHEVADTSQCSPEQSAIDSEDRKRVAHALAQLPEKNRQVLENYYFRNM